MAWGRGRWPGRLQPLLPIGVFVTVAPALIAAGAVPTLLGLGALLAVWIAVLGWLRAHPGAVTTWYPRLLIVFAGVALVSLLAAIVTDGLHGPGGYLLIGAALLSAMAPVRPRSYRALLQGGVLAVFVVAMVLEGRTWTDAVLVVALLGSIAVLVGAFAGELAAAGRRHREAVEDAERRAGLLEAVRHLPTHDLDAAADAAVHSLQDLGYDAAALALIEDDQLVLHASVDAPPLPPLPRPQGLSWQAIEQRRTVAVADYQQRPGKLAWRPDVRALVATPVMVDGEPIGVLLGTRTVVAAPSRAEVEVAEVLAAHLGGVLGTVQHERRQRELLDRMQRLEHLRAGFVSAVSAEVRDPLTVIRSVSQTLARHEDLPEEQRRQLLDRLVNRTGDLRRTIDAILDLSRFQAQRSPAVHGPVSLSNLLADVTQATGACIVSAPHGPDLQVIADPELLRHALELLLLAGGPSGRPDDPDLIHVQVDVGQVLLDLDRRGAEPSAVVRSLASQLLLAGGGELEQVGGLRVRLPIVAAGTTGDTVPERGGEEVW